MVCNGMWRYVTCDPLLMRQYMCQITAFGPMEHARMCDMFIDVCDMYVSQFMLYARCDGVACDVLVCDV